jgi:hypothetical protein
MGELQQDIALRTGEGYRVGSLTRFTNSNLQSRPFTCPIDWTQGGLASIEVSYHFINCRLLSSGMEHLELLGVPQVIYAMSCVTKDLVMIVCGICTTKTMTSLTFGIVLHEGTPSSP